MYTPLACVAGAVFPRAPVLMQGRVYMCVCAGVCSYPGGCPVSPQARLPWAGRHIPVWSRMLRFPRCHNGHTTGSPAPRGRNLISAY